MSYKGIPRVRIIFAIGITIVRSPISARSTQAIMLILVFGNNKTFQTIMTFEILIHYKFNQFFYLIISNR